eukprot:UN07395
MFPSFFSLREGDYHLLCSIFEALSSHFPKLAPFLTERPQNHLSSHSVSQTFPPTRTSSLFYACFLVLFFFSPLPFIFFKHLLRLRQMPLQPSLARLFHLQASHLLSEAAYSS